MEQGKIIKLIFINKFKQMWNYIIRKLKGVWGNIKNIKQIFNDKINKATIIVASQVKNDELRNELMRRNLRS